MLCAERCLLTLPVRLALFAAALHCAAIVSLAQDAIHRPALEEISSGKTRVIDLSYPISDKMVLWPGDTKGFEAKINATVEKNGYFTRSFWMLEHYGTHLDAPAHFPPGTVTVDKIPAEKFFGPAVVLDVRSETDRNPDYDPFRCAHPGPRLVRKTFPREFCPPSPCRAENAPARPGVFRSARASKSCV